MRFFRWKKSRNAARGKGGSEDGRMDEGAAFSKFSSQPPSTPSSLSDVLVPSYVICLGRM